MAEISSGTPLSVTNYASTSRRNIPLQGTHPLIANADLSSVITPQNAQESLATTLQSRLNDVQVETRADSSFSPQGIRFDDRSSNTGGRVILGQERAQVLRNAVRPLLGEAGRNIVNNLDQNTVNTLGSVVGVAHTLINQRFSGRGNIAGVDVTGTIDARNGTATVRTQQDVNLNGTHLNLNYSMQVGRGNKPQQNIAVSHDISRNTSISANFGTQNGQRTAGISITGTF